MFEEVKRSKQDRFDTWLAHKLYDYKRWREEVLPDWIARKLPDRIRLRVIVQVSSEVANETEIEGVDDINYPLMYGYLSQKIGDNDHGGW